MIPASNGYFVRSEVRWGGTGKGLGKRLKRGFRKDGNRTGERGGRSSSRSQQQYEGRSQQNTEGWMGGGWDWGGVEGGVCKRTRGREGWQGGAEWEATDRKEEMTATFAPSLAGWPSVRVSSNLTMIFASAPPTSGGSTPTQPLQPIRQHRYDNWPAYFVRGYMYFLEKSTNFRKK